jgi:hypothetical protein
MVNRRLGERGTFRRNRKIEYPPHSVLTDGSGNISKRPLTKGLRCFADVIEWLFGRADEATKWGDNEPQAKGCAMCPVSVTCARVVWERIETSPDLKRLHAEWEQATQALSIHDRYRHATWAALVDCVESHSWSDSNDAALIKDSEKRADRQAANKTAKRKAAKKGAKAVPQAIVDKITEYRDERDLELKVMKLGPNAPLWIRNRTLERVPLVADAWEGREMLREAGAKASGREVAEWLEERGRKPADSPPRFVKLVEEALRRADQLISNREWPPFEPRPTRPGYGMNPAVVHELFDDD